MALTPSLSLTAESIDGDAFLDTQSDVSNYDVGGNPSRSDFANYFSIDKMKSDGTVNYAVTPQTYNPVTAMLYNFSVTVDGWYRSKLILVPNYDNAVAYDQYDIVYLSGVVYRATASVTGNPPPNVSFWEVITDPITIIDNAGSATESGNALFVIKDDVIYPFAKTCFGNKTEEADCDCNCDRSEKVLAYEQAGVFVDQMNVANQRQKYSTGERIAIDATAFCGSTSSNCGCN